MTLPTKEQICAFLNDLAALTAAHGLVLDADVGGHMSLDPLRDIYGGYVARLRQEDETLWWEIGVCEAGLPIQADRVASVDITRLTAHQLVGIRAALERMRSLLRGGEG